MWLSSVLTLGSLWNGPGWALKGVCSPLLFQLAVFFAVRSQDAVRFFQRMTLTLWPFTFRRAAQPFAPYTDISLSL